MLWNWQMLLLSLMLHTVTGWHLGLSPTPERLQNRRSGDNFFVVCKVKEFDGAASDVKIEWYHEDQLIPRFGSVMTIERTYSNQLMINRPKTSDGGQYTCKAEINGETQEISAEISFVEPPKFINPQTEQHPEENEQAEIHCEVEGTDQLEVFWQFNGVTLDDASQRGYTFSENNQILYIPNFTAKKDDGIYNCNAAQFSSFETLAINVSGYARPSITVFDVPKDNRSIEGQTIELKCGAIGKPKPAYKWFFENDEVPISRSDKHNVDEEGLLIIESLNVEDAGNYKCVANNTKGTDSQSFDLIVQLKPTVELKHEHEAKEGENVKIICGFHGDDISSAKIVYENREFMEKNEEQVTDGSNIDDEFQKSEEVIDEEKPEDSEVSENSEEELVKSSETTETEGSEEIRNVKRNVKEQNAERFEIQKTENQLILTIENVLFEDAGEYTCVVTNAAGTTKKITKLGIIHPPILRHYSGPSVRSFLGHTTSIYCDVSAVPAPKWIWLKNGKEIEPNGATIKIDTQSTTTKLTLENVEGSDNFGTYSCQAENSAGTLTKNVEVIQVVAPSTPSKIDCKKIIYPNFAKCSFDVESYGNEMSKPQNMEILLAKLENMESDYNWDHAQSITTPYENETILSNLEPNSQYMVKIRAINEAGSSDLSEEISVETTDPWVPEAPTSVKMECSSFCTLAWDAPNDHGSPLLKYEIAIQEMRQEESSDEDEDEEETTPNNSEEEITTTENNESGERENEETENEEDVESKESSIEKQEIQLYESSEDIPRVLPTDAPDHNEIERIPYGEPLILDVGATTIQTRMSSIKPHSFYKISITAFNSVGKGESSEIEYQTNETPSDYVESFYSKWWIICVAVIALVLLFLVDLCCFFTNRCGLVSCICLNVCGRSSRGKPDDVESGRLGHENSKLLDSTGARFMHPITTTV